MNNNATPTNITVIDNICGSGKTSYAIQMMNDSDLQEDNFIYITPFLNEVKRVKQSVSKRRFYEPHYSKDSKTKLDSLKQLVIDGKDIVSTHALFKTVDQELIDLIKLRNYTLVLDEVMDITENLNVSKRDWDILIKEELICIDDEDNKIIWLEDEYTGRFNEVKQLASSNNLYLHSRTSKDEDKVKLLVWCFPIEVFNAFNYVNILTYLFKGQFQRYYYDMYNIKYDYKSVIMDTGTNKYILVDYDNALDEREKIKPLINIYEGNLNKIGDEDYSLSSTWLKKGLKNKNIEALRKNTHNYFQNIVKGKSADNMWTTIKGTEDKRDNIRLELKYKGYAKGFIPCNARATNEYQDKVNLAYLWNVFINPIDKGFFQDKGVKIAEDLYSISEFIQWMYRSRIRTGQDINLYIPSLRMRELLYDWLDYKI